MILLHDLSFNTTKKALIYSWLFSYLSHPKSHSVSSPSEIALQYVSYLRFTSILYIFVNILTSFEIREYSRAGPQRVWSLRIHPDSKHLASLLFALLVAHGAGPTDGPINTSSCYIKLMTLTRNLLLSLVSKWLSPGLQKIFDLIFSKMSLSTLLFHLGVNPNLLYNGSTSASMYLKRIYI